VLNNIKDKKTDKFIILMEIEKIDNDNFKVIMDEKTFNVTLDDKTYEKLTDKLISKKELIKSSFKFLLDREPKGSILKEFNIKVIKTYFPEYEKKIKNYF